MDDLFKEGGWVLGCLGDKVINRLKVFCLNVNLVIIYFW